MKKKGSTLKDVTDSDIDILKNNPKKFWRGVKYIGFDAFKNCKVPFDIEIPANVKISSMAFQQAPVRKVVLKEKLKELPGYFFKDCEQLEEVVLPDGIKVLGISCFEKCTKLKSINLPDSINHISSDCFRASGIQEVVLPKGLEMLGANAFKNCYSLKEVIFSNLDSKDEYEKRNKMFLVNTRVGESCFKGCLKLEKVENFSSVFYLGKECFEFCAKLKNIDLSNITHIPKNTFNGCKTLKDVQFCDKLSRIEQSAFNSTAIETINFDKLKLLGDRAFENCANLKQVNISKCQQLNIVGKSVFSCCDNLKEVQLPSNIEIIADGFCAN